MAEKREKDILADLLFEEQDPNLSLRLIGDMGITAAELGSGINVSGDKVESWFAGDSSDITEHELAIHGLKSTILFLLRRGILNPSQLALWLTLPNPDLEDETPLATMPKEGGLDAVLQASRTFTRPEPAPWGRVSDLES
jgi:hypothetical protein